MKKKTWSQAQDTRRTSYYWWRRATLTNNCLCFNLSQANGPLLAV